MSFEWPSVKLSELITIKHGFAFKGEYFSDTPTAYQLTTPGNFAIDGGFQLGKGKYYSGPIPEDYILSPGDLIVTMTDLSKAADTLGYAAVVPDTRGSIYLHNQRVGLVQIKSYFKILPNFLHYLMRSDGYRHWIISSASGSTVKHTSPGRICEYQFNLPSVYEQEQIGSILTVFDNQITLLRETNKTLEAIAQAIFKSWFVDFDPVRAKQKGREPEGMDADTAALFPDRFEESELGLIPKGWDVLPLTEVTTFREGPGILAKDFKEKGVPLIRLAGLKNGVSLLDGCNFLDPVRVEEKWSQFRLLKGDILLSSSASLGRVAEVDDEAVGAVPYTGIIGFRPIENKTFQRYVLQYLTSSYFQDQVSMMGSGSVLNHFGPTHLKKMTMLVPSLPTQLAFSDIVDPIKKAQYIQLKKSDTLSNLRDTLLPRLISGQLRLPDAESMVEEAVL